MTDLEKRIKKEVREWWVTDSNYSKLLSLETLIKNIVRDETALLSQHIIDLQKDKGNLTDRVRELEAQIEKLIDFVLSKTECCDVCPITDTCINSEGVCHYAGILAKGEEEVTRKWLMQFISKEIKEK